MAQIDHPPDLPTWARFHACGRLLLLASTTPEGAATGQELAELLGGKDVDVALGAWVSGPKRALNEDHLDVLLKFLGCGQDDLVREANVVLDFAQAIGDASKWVVCCACRSLRHRKEREGKGPFLPGDLSKQLGLKSSSSISNTFNAKIPSDSIDKVDVRIGWMRLVRLLELLGCSPQEVGTEVAFVQRVFQLQNRGGLLPSIGGRADPHTLLLQWAFSFEMRMGLREICPELAGDGLDQHIKCSFHIQPNRSRLRLTNNAVHSADWTPFRYATRHELQAEHQRTNEVRVLRDWSFELKPSFALIERVNGQRPISGQAVGLSIADAEASRDSEWAKGQEARAIEALDPIKAEQTLIELLSNRRFLVGHGTRREVKLKRLLEFLSRSRFAAESYSGESGANLGSLLLESHRTFVELRHLESGSISGEHVIVCGAPEYWAVRNNPDCGFRVIATDEGLRKSTERWKSLAAEEIDWAPDVYLLADPRSEAHKLDPIGSRLAAGFFQRASAMLRRSWNADVADGRNSSVHSREQIASVVLQAYRDYGGPGIALASRSSDELQLEYIVRLISDGMNLTHVPPGEDSQGVSEFINLDEFESQATIPRPESDPTPPADRAEQGTPKLGNGSASTSPNQT